MPKFQPYNYEIKAFDCESENEDLKSGKLLGTGQYIVKWLNKNSIRARIFKRFQNKVKFIFRLYKCMCTFCYVCHFILCKMLNTVKKNINQVKTERPKPAFSRIPTQLHWVQLLPIATRLISK